MGRAGIDFPEKSGQIKPVPNHPGPLPNFVAEKEWKKDANRARVP